MPCPSGEIPPMGADPSAQHLPAEVMPRLPAHPTPSLHRRRPTLSGQRSSTISDQSSIGRSPSTVAVTSYDSRLIWPWWADRNAVSAASRPVEIRSIERRGAGRIDDVPGAVLQRLGDRVEVHRSEPGRIDGDQSRGPVHCAQEAHGQARAVPAHPAAAQDRVDGAVRWCAAARDVGQVRFDPPADGRLHPAHPGTARLGEIRDVEDRPVTPPRVDRCARRRRRRQRRGGPGPPVRACRAQGGQRPCGACWPSLHSRRARRTGSGRRMRLRLRDVDHLRDAEAIRAHAELVAPHLLLQRHGHRAAVDQLVPVAPQLGRVVAA